MCLNFRGYLTCECSGVEGEEEEGEGEEEEGEGEDEEGLYSLNPCNACLCVYISLHVRLSVNVCILADRSMKPVIFEKSVLEVMHILIDL